MKQSFLKGQTVDLAVTGPSPEISLVTCVLAAARIISLQSNAACTLRPDRYVDISRLCMTIYAAACEELRDEKELLLAEREAQESLDVLDGMTRVEQQLHMMSLASCLTTMATTPGFERTVINGLLGITAYTQKNLNDLLPEVTTLLVPALTARDYDVFRLMLLIGVEITYKVDDRRFAVLNEELIERFGATGGQETFDPVTREEHQAVFSLLNTTMGNLDEWCSGALSILETALAFYSSNQSDPLIDSLLMKVLQQRMRLRDQQKEQKH